MKHRLLLGFLLYSLAPILVFVFDIFVLQRPSFSGPGDGLSSSFYLSLNTYLGDPYDIHHQPAYFHNTIGAAIIALTGLASTSLTSYYHSILITHVLIVLISAYWISRVSKDCNFPLYAILLIGILAASMPVLIGLQNVFAPYFLDAHLLVPVVFSAYRIVSKKTNPILLVFLLFLTLGILVGDTFLVLPIIAALLLSFAISLPWSNSHALKAKLAANRPFRILSFLEISIFVSLCWFFLESFRWYLESHKAPDFLLFLSPETRLYWVVGALVIPIIFSLRLPAIRDCYLVVVRSAGLPFLLGWALATNIHYRGFGFSLMLAAKRADTERPSLIAQFTELVTHANWFALLIVAILISVLALSRSRNNSSKTERTSTRFIGFFTISAILLAFYAATSKSPLIFSPTDHYGDNLVIQTRFLGLTLCAVALPVVWLFSESGGGRLMKVLAFSLITLIGAVSLKQYFTEMYPLYQTTRTLDTTVKSHLNRSSDHMLICVDTMMPDYCQLLHGYQNTSALESAASRLRVRSTLNDRVFYIEEVSLDCDIESNGVKKCLGVDTHPDNIMIVCKDHCIDAISTKYKALWSDDRLGIAALVLKW